MPLQTLQTTVSVVQSDVLYRPESLAHTINNMMLTDDPGNTLRSGGMNSPYELPSVTVSGYINGICAAESLGGANQVVVFHSGNNLYVHEGWNRTFTVVQSGLTYTPTATFPDAMVAINGRVIWSNGVDQPRVVDGTTSYGRLCVPLGFDRPPGAPTVLCPNSGAESTEGVSNYNGYAHVGDIGTVQPFDGEDGALLAGRWKYCVLWEDIFGNLSPASADASAWITNASAGYLPSTSTDYKRLNHMDSLTRMFCVRGITPGDDHVAAIHVYRTLDQLNNTDREFYLLCRLAGNERFTVPDKESDGVLAGSDVMQRCTAVRPFRVACAYQGRLVVGNFQEAPGTVRWSEPGFPGTFLEDNYAIPSEGGAQVTGLTAWGDALVVFTDRSIYMLEVEGDAAVRPLFQGVGCAAPCSIQTLSDGRLVWLSASGFYAMARGQAPERISQPISRLMARLPAGTLGRTVSAIDPQTGAYLASVCATGPVQDLVLCFDPRSGGWTQFDQAFRSTTAMCQQPGHAAHVLMGSNLTGVGNTLRVWNRGSSVSGGTYTFSYTSNPIRIDPSGSVPFRLRAIIIEFAETAIKDGGSATLSVYPDDAPESTPVTYPVDMCRDEALASWPYGGLTVGTSSLFRQPLLRARRVSVDLNTMTGFRFKLQSSTNIRQELVGFRFIIEAQDNNKSSRTPGALRG